MESSRFPNKILADINGKKMIVVVYELALKSQLFDEIYVATHNTEIKDLCERSNIPCISTSASHPCGSSRVFEAAKSLKSNWDIVVNLQADQPFLPLHYLKAVLAGLEFSDVGTIAYPDRLNESEHTVKVIMDHKSRAVYFSRYPIPFDVTESDLTRYCHLGLYAYKREFVLNYEGDFRSALALAESLEQLDFIYNGNKIGVALVDAAVPEVNVPEDINIAKNLGFL